MGDLFSGSTKTTTSEQTDTGPSKFQKPYLDTAFNAAQSNFNSQNGTPAYQGETYASMSPEQQATLKNLTGYAGGAGVANANSIANVGTGLINSSAGKAGTLLDRFTAMAGEDPTQANIAKAQAYANDPSVNGLIDANARDIGRTLNEQTLPGIDRSASGSGNINSSRAGVASGIAMRGAADRVGDISAQIRSDAYNRGLDRASADRNTTLGALRDASSGYSGLTGQGINAIGQGTQLGYDAYGQQVQAGAMGQADRQGQDSAALDKFNRDDTRQSDLLARYMQIVGGNQWGQSGTSSGTSTQKNSGNIFGQLAGAAATAASFF